MAAVMFNMLDEEDGVLDAYEKLLCRYFVQAGHVYCEDESASDRVEWKPAEYPQWMQR